MTELQCIKGGQDETNRGMSSFQAYMQNSFKLAEQVVTATNRNTDIIKTLAYKQIDLEARSRRNNLIFWGINERAGENCFHLIREVITNRLDLEGERMYLARAHRLGQRKIGQQVRSRPIIVNFRDFHDTERIMTNVYMLRNTPISVDLDLPKEINEARKRLWPKLKEAKNKRYKAHIVYPAKLLVEGKVVQNEFPDWFETVGQSRLIDFTHIEINKTVKQSTNQHDHETVPLNLQHHVDKHNDTPRSTSRSGADPNTTSQTITNSQGDNDSMCSHCSDDSVVRPKVLDGQIHSPFASSTPLNKDSIHFEQHINTHDVQPSIFRSCAPVNIPVSNLHTTQTVDNKLSGEEAGRSHSSRSVTRTNRRSTPYKRINSDSRSRDRFSRCAKNRTAMDSTRNNEMGKPTNNNKQSDPDHDSSGAT